MSATLERGFSLRMSARDLITIGIFAGLYTVTVFTVVLLGFSNPALLVVTAAASIVVGGVPFMLFLTRVSHGGMVLLFALVVSGLQLFSGHPAVGLPLSLLLAAVAELLLWIGRYRSRTARVAAYAVLSVWTIGPWLPILWLGDDSAASTQVSRMNAQLLGPLGESLGLLAIAVLALIACALGAVGGVLGLALTRRHFARAGLAPAGLA